ncbi:DnaJ-like protein [Rhynchospora pubera]|uniref:DnaJ-like protein n=1 Tax=Rhynchospora pubera TaxID=906938 RepID=A0AAV8C3B6_9POAL|nr:DnaJ-like protein [Rhynchospora pubera]KAJ4820931.1 DnaJ-like protein [Rhynchospora pubera]
MDGNKDDAIKCLRIGKEALEAGDRTRALKFLTKARRLDPSLPIDDLLSAASSSPSEEGSSSQPPEAEAPTTDAAASSSSSPASSSSASVRHRKTDASTKASGNGTSGGGYTEEQVEIVREIKRKQKDYYQMLSLEKSCTVEDVRKAYRKLSLKVHPDKNKAPGSEEAFKAVSKAFQCLSNEESRKRYDLVGSDEPVTHRRTATRHRNGYRYYDEDEFDADEIFRNFFYGGMAPATTPFGTFHFQMGRQHGHGGGHGSAGGGGSPMRMLIQILPVIILLLLNFLPSSDPIYTLSRSYSYEHKVQTQRGVNYFVKSAAKFEQEYPLQSVQRAHLEQRVEREYVGAVSQNCRLELQRRQWGFSHETPYCDLLRKYEEAVTASASASA